MNTKYLGYKKIRIKFVFYWKAIHSFKKMNFIRDQAHCLIWKIYDFAPGPIYISLVFSSVHGYYSIGVVFLSSWAITLPFFAIISISVPKYVK